MKLSSTFTFKMDVTGNTGYCNQSQLELTILQLGAIKLAYHSWDLSHINFDGYTIKQLILKIPCGTLTIYEPICKETEMGWKLEFTGQGDFEGYAKALNLGASGYGSFSFDHDKATVSGSVFNIPSDMRCGWFGTSQANINIGVAAPSAWCSYDEYNLRVNAMDKKHGYEQVREWAKEVHEILALLEVNEEKNLSYKSPTKTDTRPILKWVERITEAIKEYQLTAI
jgi:hypothetical protein